MLLEWDFSLYFNAYLENVKESLSCRVENTDFPPFSKISPHWNSLLTSALKRGRTSDGQKNWSWEINGNFLVVVGAEKDWILRLLSPHFLICAIHLPTFKYLLRSLKGERRQEVYSIVEFIFPSCLLHFTVICAVVKLLMALHLTAGDRHQEFCSHLHFE